MYVVSFKPKVNKAYHYPIDILSQLFLGDVILTPTHVDFFFIPIIVFSVTLCVVIIHWFIIYNHKYKIIKKTKDNNIPTYLFKYTQFFYLYLIISNHIFNNFEILFSLNHDFFKKYKWNYVFVTRKYKKIQNRNIILLYIFSMDGIIFLLYSFFLFSLTQYKRVFIVNFYIIFLIN